MFKPVIGISCGKEAESNSWFSRSYYAEAVCAFGGNVVLLPTQKPADACCLISRLDGLILAGGGDIHPQFWGEEPWQGLGRVDLERDNWELALFDAAVNKSLPILGICRGMQLINVACGGTLWQQNPGNACHVQTSPYGQVWHGLEITDAAFAELCVAEAETNVETDTGTVMVNSCHHQCVRRAGKNLRIVAKAKDGIVEAMLGEPNIWAVQWHPEYLFQQKGISRSLFKLFVEQCMQKKQDSA